MKRIWRERDKYGGVIEIWLLDNNNVIAEDLIWLHIKNKKGQENGFVMTPYEARIIICGLFLALDEVIEQYKLEKFKVKKSGAKNKKVK